MYSSRPIRFLERYFVFLFMIGTISVLFSLIIQVDLSSVRYRLQTKSHYFIQPARKRGYYGSEGLGSTVLMDQNTTMVTPITLLDTTIIFTNSTTTKLMKETEPVKEMKTTQSPDIFDDIEALANQLSNLTRKRLVENLAQTPMGLNFGNVKLYRNKLKSEVKMLASEHLMLTRKNTPLNSKIPSLDGPAVKATKDIFNDFPDDSLLGKIPKRCSIVGSSDILSGSQCGSRIDSSDMILRFNLATTIGFEKDVGNKTSMTTMNPSIFRKQYKNLKTKELTSDFSNLLKKHNALIWVPAFAYYGNHKHTFNAIRKIRPINKNLHMVLQDTKHFIALNKFWTHYGFKKTIMSTGFYFVSSAIEFCDELDVYGFWPFNTSSDGRTLAYHYYDSIPFDEHHNMPWEFSLLSSMHDLGLLRLHVGNCTE